MTGPHLSGILVDAADPERAAGFWAAILGATPVRTPGDDVVVRGGHPDLVFTPQVSAKTVKNRVHLDVYVASVAPLLDADARLLAHYPDESRTTLADPEGNEFCAFTDPALPTRARARIFAVCTDSAQPEAIAAWWAGHLGARVDPGPDGTPRWLSGGAGWGEVIWKFVRVHDARVTPNRWRWQIAESSELVSAGAQLTATGVMTDPDGNDFAAL